MKPKIKVVQPLLALTLSALVASMANATTFCQEALIETSLSPKLFRHAPNQATEPLKADRAKQARLTVDGGQALTGRVTVDPAKNAYLPILAATLLNEHPVELVDLPALRDIETFLEIYKGLGVRISQNGNITTIDASKVRTNIATCDLIKTFRASILILGPMITRFQGGMVGLPGGCPIGSRPIDIHLKALKEMGASVVETQDYVMGEVDGRLQGANLDLSFPSVGATQHLVMAAVLAEGTTVIRNAAREPEVQDLVQFLNAMGANITSHGTGNIVIRGVDRLQPGTRYRAIGDRIEAATYIIGALMTDTELTVDGFDPKDIRTVLDTLIQMGAHIFVGKDFVTVHKGSHLRATHVVTGPHPEFPTDVQAQLMALMTQAEGTSTIQETIFENRFQHASEMNKMGADIRVEGNLASVHGPTPLQGAKVRCTDLRGGISLVINALIAQGTTELTDIYYVDRGYHRFQEKFAQMGACQMVRHDSTGG